MKIAPNATVTLYRSVDIEPDSSIVFSSKQNRESYFAKKKVIDISPVQVVKKTGQIKIPLRKISGENLEKCNYLSFINPSFENKIWYCAITHKDYINNETAVVTYMIDYWMSCMFDVRYGDMYIDREHVSMSDWNKLQANPYDPSIHEMRTPESALVVGEDIQKRDYQIDNRNDAFLVCKQTVGSNDLMVNVIYIKTIDFSQLNDDGTDDNIDVWDIANFNKVSMSRYWYAMLNGFGYARDEYDGPDLPVPEDPSARPLSGFYIGPDRDKGGGTMGTILGTQPIWNSHMSHPYWVIGFTDYKPDTVFNIDRLVQKLTASGLQDAILGIYTIPSTVLRYMNTLELPDGGLVPWAFTINVTGKDAVRADYSNADPKLFQFPYSYLKFTTPDGNSKEYKYEDFASNQAGRNQEVFAMTGDLSEKPRLVMQPDDYKYRSGAYGNPLEQVIFDQFPTAPYDIDAWKAQFAAVATNMIANADAVSLTQMMGEHAYRANGGVLGTLVSAGDFIAGLGGDVPDAGVYSGGASSSSGNSSFEMGGYAQANAVGLATKGPGAVANMLTKKETSRLTVNAWQDVNAAKSGMESAGMMEMFGHTRQAFVVNQYHRSTGDGMTHYNANGFLDILVTHVRLMPYVLRVYTKYFDNYGYKSWRCGIPHVIGYSKGNDEPAWRNVNGKQSTYVRTADCKVYGNDVTICNSISNMFNAGIRLLKGEAL